MSRRARRERPATPEEQQQIERFMEAARAALDAPAGVDRAAVARMGRAVDRIVDPHSLSKVPRRELVDALRDRYPDPPDRDHSMTAPAETSEETACRR